MTTMYMHCPNCGADVPPRVNCGACGAFAMAKALYEKLHQLSDETAWASRTKAVDELIRLKFVSWSESKARYIVTRRGLQVLARLA